jgi:hypothetical protein
MMLGLFLFAFKQVVVVVVVQVGLVHSDLTVQHRVVVLHLALLVLAREVLLISVVDMDTKVE